MADQNHIKNAGENVMNSARSTLNNALEGHYREAVDSAREGTVNAAKELGKSVMETTAKVGDSVQNVFSTKTSRVQNVTDDTAVERSDSMYSAFTPKNK